MSADPGHQPFYCEENAWRRARALSDAGRAPVLLFISGLGGGVVCFAQRAAGPSGYIVWDYHAVVLCDGEIHDPDCTAGPRLPAAAWLAATFPEQVPVPVDLQPRFRWAPWPLVRDTFTTDRSHMRDPQGGWLQPPPPWSPPTAPGHPMNLPRWASPSADGPGEVIDLRALLARLQ